MLAATDTTETSEPGRDRTPVSQWQPLAVLAAIPFVFLRIRLGPVSDPDTYWHLRAGQHLLRSWSFAGRDPYSAFTSRPWLLHEWIPELLTSWADAWFGLPGVAWLAFAGYLILFAMLVRASRERAGLLPSILAAFVGWIGAIGSLTPRPQIVTLIFIVVTVSAWHRTLRDGKPRWWLVPLSWIWASSHGMWFIGPLIGLFAILALLLDRRVDMAHAWRLAAIPASGVLIAALTPVGPALLTAPFSVSDYIAFVSEWGPPNIRDLFAQATFGMLVVIAVVWARKPPASWFDILTWCLALGWSLLYARTVAVGAVLVAPLFAQTLHVMLGRGIERRSRAEGFVLAGAIGSALLLAAVLSPKLAAQPGQMPTSLDDSLDALPAKTVVFDEYELGGWLMWRHPSLHPVVDPRTELFDIGYFKRYLAARQAEPGWPSFIDETRSGAAVVPISSALGQALKDVRGWTEVGRGDGYLLLKAP